MGAKLFGLGRERHVTYMIALWSQATGDLVAVMDAHRVTVVRTAATSALAAESVLGRRPVTVGIIGSGKEAYNHLEALCSLGMVERAWVYSPTRQRREAFAARAREELGLDCRTVDEPADAVQGRELVVAATRPYREEPSLLGRWLNGVRMAVSIGSTLPEQREVDAEVIRRAAKIIVDSDEVLEDTGDMLAARQAGIEVRGRVVRLHQVVMAAAVGGWRAGAEGLVLYKSCGSGLQDMAVAAAVYERARLRPEVLAKALRFAVVRPERR
jgi:ornithine cyclodeaminase/alanine dehydrogenase